MDYVKATQEVKTFRMHLDSYRVQLQQYPGAIGTTSDPTGGLRMLIGQRLPLIEEIADEVALAEPERLRLWNLSHYWDRAMAAVDELLGTLEGRERRNEVMGATGPKLAASRMHRWVWQPAAELWDNGHRREAVQAAATFVLEQQLPAKLNVAKGAKPRDLISQAFSLDAPTPGKVRLRLPGYTEGDNDWKNAHEGAMFLGFACAGAVRNLNTHTTAQPDEDVALESLAALSLLARWIDEAKVETD